MAKRKREVCFYCNSSRISHPRRTSFRNRLFFFASAFFDPNANRKSIVILSCVNCGNCERRYQKIKCEQKVLKKLIAALHPTRSALQNYKNIFTTKDFSGWDNKTVQMVQPEKNALHIIFTFRRIKAYLDCRKIKGHFVIISVEVLQ